MTCHATCPPCPRCEELEEALQDLCDAITTEVEATEDEPPDVVCLICGSGPEACDPEEACGKARALVEPQRSQPVASRGDEPSSGSEGPAPRLSKSDPGEHR